MASARKILPDWGAAFLRRKPSRPQSQPGWATAKRRPDVQPHYATTALMMGGGVSWEMVHLISEVAFAQDHE